MVTASDNKEFLSYAKHCEGMAVAANSEIDKALWLKLAAAWRRQLVEPIEEHAFLGSDAAN